MLRLFKYAVVLGGINLLALVPTQAFLFGLFGCNKCDKVCHMETRIECPCVAACDLYNMAFHVGFLEGTYEVGKTHGFSHFVGSQWDGEKLRMNMEKGKNDLEVLLNRAGQEHRGEVLRQMRMGYMAAEKLHANTCCDNIVEQYRSSFNQVARFESIYACREVCEKVCERVPRCKPACDPCPAPRCNTCEPAPAPTCNMCTAPAPAPKCDSCSPCAGGTCDYRMGSRPY